jgi:hypothetical protein
MGALAYRHSKLVGVNAHGHRLGEDHPRAKLTDHEVELIRELAEPSDGSPPMSHRMIASKFEISRGTVGDILSCRRRACYAVAWRRVPLLKQQAPESSLTAS